MSNKLQAKGKDRLRIEYVFLSNLIPMPHMLRQHSRSQIKALEKSIKAFGFKVPVLVDGGDRLIAGQARVEAAKNLGMAEVPAIRVEDMSETQIQAFRIADNRLAELGTWDEKVLGTILLELSDIELGFDLEATGFGLAEIQLKIAGLGEANGQEEERDRILVASGPALTRPGDHWALGDHRLVCGDALDPNSWQRLMGDGRADIVITDPPFNVRIDGHVSGLGRHQHREFAFGAGEMTAAQFTAFLHKAMFLAYKWSRMGSAHYWAMDWRHVVEIGTAGNAVYERFLNMAVWAKNQPGMGSFYRSQHELFFVYAKGGAAPRNNIQLGQFGRSRSNVWTYPSAASLARTAEEGNPLAMHPTVKPLALIADILLDASVRGDIVVDPFAGSGTTLIAAEKLGRKARCMELDPAYCDTIIRRWQHWTGETAVRGNDGAPFKALDTGASGGHS